MIVFLVFLACLLSGCGVTPSGERSSGIVAQNLAGTDDVELTYEAAEEAPSSSASEDAAFGDDLRALVLRRLSAAQIGADVTTDERRVRIIVDEMRAPRVNELVTWTGALTAYDPDPDVVLMPRDRSSGLELVTSEDGHERWYEGSRPDVLRAIETWPVDKSHRILAEAPWSEGTEGTPRHAEATANAAAHWRTRVVKATPIGELGDGARASWGDGPTIRIRADRGSPAADLIDEVHRQTAPAILARGHVSLGRVGFDDGMILSFGSGAEAYARAQQERRLLTTPRLPSLRRVDAMGLPPNRELATACLLLPVALSLAWLAFVRRFDRAHPEPLWLVATTFVLGAVSTAPAALSEYVLSRASPWLDPNLATLGGQLFAFPLALVVFIVVVGLSEEGSKRLAVELALRRPEFDEPVDGIVYAIVASLGFAAAENVRYFAIGRLNAPLVIARCFMSVPAHMFFGAIWGYGLGARLVDPKKRAWVWLGLAAACHGLFDALLSTEGGAVPAIILNLGLASVFVVLVRDALRHGVVTPEMRAIRPEDRALFRVGRPVLFWTSAIVLHLLALGIFGLGAYYQMAHHRPSAAFVIGSSLMLALLGFAALGLSATLPLDVAVDAYGVTFAGAARPWRKIRGVAARPHQIELDCEGGPIVLGPGPANVIDALRRELEKNLGASRLSTLESVGN
jgi:RsiW-degrading membrane proteinase PrsW (M82 family)